MDPLSVGRSCYKQKDYENALKAFTEGIKISSGHILLTALDHRAATFEKLNQLQPALKDAKEMIELKPGLSKGYLRCAKVLQLKGEDSLALKIYERGLKKVKVGDDSNRPVLQEMFSKLLEKQIPAKNFDPMVMLPPELAHMVCEYLDMRDRVICLAVSKPWKRFLEASHDLWTVLDVRSPRRFVRLDSLKAHLRRSSYGLDRAFITVSPHIFAGRNLEILARSCKRLSHLEISSTEHLGESLLAALPKAENLRILIVKVAAVPLLSVAKALSYCPQLQTAKFHLITLAPIDAPPVWPQLNSLVSLKLEMQVSGHRRLNLDQLILCTPNLQSASLISRENLNYNSASYRFVDFSLWGKLQRLEFTYTCMTALPSFPRTLKYLDLTQNHIWPSPLPTDENIAAVDLPLLETLIWEWTASNLGLVLALIRPSVKAGNLQTLYIDNLAAPDRSKDGSVLPDDLLMPSLQELSLRKCQMQEDGILRFLRHCPNLRCLDVSYTNITGVAVKELMTRDSGPLSWLGANACPCLSSDAVEWARSLGAVVEYNYEPLRRPVGRRFFRDRLAT